MSTAPVTDIDLATFTDDPYPMLAQMRLEAPVTFVPQLGATVFTKRDDIFREEKRIDVFSSRKMSSRLVNTVAPNCGTNVTGVSLRIRASIG